MVGAAELGQRAPAGGRGAEAVEEFRELVEVKQQHEEPRAQLVRHGVVAAVAHPALVRAARDHRAQSPSTARSAETTPSSWKPQPQCAPQ